MDWKLVLLLEVLLVLVPLASVPVFAVESIPFCQPVSSSVHVTDPEHENDKTDFSEEETVGKMVSCILNRSLFNMVTDLTVTGLVRKLDPFYIRYLEYDILEPDIGLNVSGSLRDFNVDNFSKLFVRSFDVDLRRMESILMLEFERVHATADYNIAGNMTQDNTTAELFGNGQFKANFSNVSVKTSVTFSMPNLMLQMQAFDYDYEVGNFHVEMDGAFHDPIISVLLNSMANDVGTKFLNERKPLVKKMIREQVKSFVSNFLMSQVAPRQGPSPTGSDNTSHPQYNTLDNFEKLNKKLTEGY